MKMRRTNDDAVNWPRLAAIVIAGVLLILFFIWLGKTPIALLT